MKKVLYQKTIEESSFPNLINIYINRVMFVLQFHLLWIFAIFLNCLTNLRHEITIFWTCIVSLYRMHLHQQFIENSDPKATGQVSIKLKYQESAINNISSSKLRSNYIALATEFIFVLLVYFRPNIWMCCTSLHLFLLTLLISSSA